MSKSKEGVSTTGSGKHEKFSCIANCLPMKGCLHLGGKRTSKNIPNTAAVTYNLASGKKADRRDVMFEPTTPDSEDAKMAHTKQWLANLSTMVSFDPSYLDDSELNGTIIDNQQTPTGAKTHSVTENSAGRKVRHLSDGGNKENYRAMPRMMSEDDSIIEMKRNGGARPNTPCTDSFISTTTDCDSSHLSSRCCSQHPQQQPQHRHHRRRLNRTSSSASAMSASTLGGGGHLSAWQGDHGDTSSICSGSSSTISLATELVTLDLDACSHLGITIVGHSNAAQGDCGIFVGCVKKGGAAARSGRIEPGDLILEVNDIDLEKMSNEQALLVLKGELGRGGQVRILVAKYWDMNEGGPGGLEHRQEPLYEAVGSVRSAPMSRPGSVCAGHIIEPSESTYRCSSQPPGSRALRAIPEARIQQGSGQGAGGHHSRAREFHEAAGMSSSELEKLYDLSKAAKLCSNSQQKPRTSAISSSSSSVHTGYPDSGYHENVGYRASTGGGGYTMQGGPGPALPQHSMTLDRRLRSAAAARPSSVSGVEPSGGGTRPFRGIELIDWIQGQVSGLGGRKDAQRYAQNLLNAGHICTIDVGSSASASPTDGDVTFQEHRYYTFGHQAAEARQSKML